jgi:hypothetical protein
MNIEPPVKAAIVVGIFLASFFIASAAMTYRQLSGDGSPAPDVAAIARK